MTVVKYSLSRNPSLEAWLGFLAYLFSISWLTAVESRTGPFHHSQRDHLPSWWALVKRTCWSLDWNFPWKKYLPVNGFLTFWLSMSRRIELKGLSSCLLSIAHTAFLFCALDKYLLSSSKFTLLTSRWVLLFFWALQTENLRWFVFYLQCKF